MELQDQCRLRREGRQSLDVEELLTWMRGLCISRGSTAESEENGDFGKRVQLVGLRQLIRTMADSLRQPRSTKET